MELPVEQRLFKCLLSNAFFKRVRKVVSSGMFSGDARLIFAELEKFHATHECDIGPNDLRVILFAAHPTLTPQNRRTLNGFFDGVEVESAPSEAVALEILQTFRRKQLAFDIAKKGYEGINTDVDIFQDVLALAKEGVELKTEISFTQIPTDIDSVVESANPKNLFKFRIPLLQQELAGAGRGNLLVLMARPEVGKSSFAADCSVGWLEQGLTVHYFGNEEPAHKIILNHVRAKFNLTDTDIRAKLIGKSFDREVWNKLREKLSIYDCVGMSVEELNLHAEEHKPDIIIADQVDKFKVSGNFGTMTEQLKGIYVAAREVAKRNDLLFTAVCQASADAQDHRYVDYSMADMSKTGKAGEADMFMGIGKDPGVDETYIRYITLSKNKIDGIKKSYEVMFHPDTNKWESVQ